MVTEHVKLKSGKYRAVIRQNKVKVVSAEIIIVSKADAVIQVASRISIIELARLKKDDGVFRPQQDIKWN